MVELNQTEPLQIFCQLFQLMLKTVHLVPQSVLILQVLMSQSVQSIIVILKQLFYGTLVVIQLDDQSLLTLDVAIFQVDQFLLNVDCDTR